MFSFPTVAKKILPHNGHSWETALMALFIFALPLQIRLRFPDSTSILFGNHNSYAVKEVYLFDILLLALLLVWGGRTIFFQSGKNPDCSRLRNTTRLPLLFATVFLASALTASLQSLIPSIAFYRLARHILVLGTLFFCINYPFSQWQKHILAATAVLAMTAQSLLGCIQVLLQQSLLFPLLKYLGQPNLAFYELGISVVELWGARLIRAYGTFPHPNVLAVFLLFSLFLILWIWKQGKCPSRRIGQIILILHITALIATFSRSVWLCFAGLVIFFLLATEKKNKNFCSLPLRQRFCRITKQTGWLGLLGFIGILTIVAQRLLYLLQPGTYSVTERLTLNGIALAMLADHWLLGIGLGHFVLMLHDYDSYGVSHLYQQPAHHTILLACVEIGVLGGVAWLGLVFFPGILTIFSPFSKNLAQGKNALSLAPSTEKITIVLGISCILWFLFHIDHYFWDIPQTMYLLGILTGISWRIATKTPSQREKH